MPYDETEDSLDIPVKIVCAGQDVHGEYYLEFSVESPSKENSTFVLPLATLNTHPDELFKRLGARGVTASDPKVRRSFLNNIQNYELESPCTVLTNLGWTGHIFSTPVITYPSEIVDVMVCHDKIDRPHKWAESGSISDWKKFVRKYCKGNHFAIFVLCAAFVPPLLDILKAEGFGFLFYGRSSIGKSTLMHLASAVWGGDPEQEKGFAESYLFSKEGMELPAYNHRDQLLVLDDTKLAGRSEKERGQLIADMIFRFSLGTEKTRFTNSDAPKTWRLCHLSTSNKTLQKIFAVAGLEFDSSFEVRLIQIDAEVGEFGVFNRLPNGLTGGMLSKKLKAGSKKYYGIPRKKYLEKLVAWRAGDETGLEKWLNKRQGYFGQNAKTENLGEVEARIAEHFELVYAAGCLAEIFDVLPFDRKEIFEAINYTFRAHRKLFKVNAPLQDPVAVVRKYIRRCKKGFINLRNGLPTISDENFENQEGFVRKKNGSTEFMIPQDLFEKCLEKLGPPSRLYAALKEQELLIHDKRKNTIKRQVRKGDRDRVVCIKGTILN